ncbi:MAG: helix-turn-helix transcriptional regulator [Clostridia bacterium]|nr:helix-turn-helix transcriptional regulator [Clostridia bacterium]
MFFKENAISIELLGVFKISRRKYVNYKAHSRSYDTLSIRLSGNSQFKTQKDDFSVTQGKLLYLPKNVEYQQMSEDETLIAIHFINYSSDTLAQAEIIDVDDVEYVEGLIKQMYDVWKGLNVGYQYKCTSLFYELLYYLRCREHDGAISAITEESKIKNALDIIHSSYRKEQIDISALARSCALSEAYFRKLFKKIHGVSPSQYIIDLKLDFASHLLQSGLYTVGEVAQRSGFSDPKYFSRIFKARFSLSPKEYQQKFEEQSDMTEKRI